MLYKYIGARQESEALQIMKYFCEEYTLKISEPTSFNDPFEFKIAIDFDADDSTIRKRFFQDKPDASEPEYQEWRRHHTKQSQWWSNQETRRELLSRFGVFCMSAVADDHLMWSHYAANHTGFCVGLDEAQLAGLNGLIGQGFVKYQEEAPTFRYFFESPDLFQNRVFGCKSTCWSYEHEYRFVFDHSGLLQFPQAALREISLGCRAHQQLRSYARDRCEEGSVSFFQMCEDFQAYRLVTQPVEKNTSPMSSFFRSKSM